ncbi:MAG: phosphoribosylaminoimidazolesuccinocarboxamide synthase, partial [Treponema sp.]|nr:phosphoribosylaminoimidazolesuccinocarboxamide synthase [Treponema sp.]
FWDASKYQVGGSPASYDKQFVRDWLKEHNLAGDPTIKEIPAEVVAKTSAIYKECQTRICRK